MCVYLISLSCINYAIISSFLKGFNGYTPVARQDDDQLRLQEFLLNWQERGVRYPFQLDHECCLFQTLGPKGYHGVIGGGYIYDTRIHQDS